MEPHPPHNPSATWSIDTQVKSDKLRLLVQQSYLGLFVSLAVSLLLCWALWDYTDTTILLVWFGVMFLSTLTRAYLYLVHFRPQRNTQETLQHARPYVAALIVSTLIWGVGALFIMPKDSLLGQAFTMFILIGMAGGVLATYSAHRSTAITGMLSILLPVTLWLYFQPSKLHLGMAIGATIFIVVTLRGAKILSDAMHRNFHLGYELQHAYEEANTLSKMDALTGINNRRSFFECGEQISSYCERNNLPLSAIVMDVDHFKRINDTHGHHFGDITLSQIGRILEAEFRKSDVLGRLGGEEFAILLPDTTLNQAQELAEKLRQTIAATPITIKDKQLSITISIGVASGHYDIETLLPHADAAMYQAKSGGRNRTVIASAT
ncbi:MAG: GGDEF domain-containing protein [Nitrosomonadales bacterium]|nr:GGDEF domain-containing protein [Nitrosomonadales bacterium]